MSNRTAPHTLRRMTRRDLRAIGQLPLPVVSYGNADDAPRERKTILRLRMGA